MFRARLASREKTDVEKAWDDVSKTTLALVAALTDCRRVDLAKELGMRNKNKSRFTIQDFSNLSTEALTFHTEYSNAYTKYYELEFAKRSQSTITTSSEQSGQCAASKQGRASARFTTQTQTRRRTTVAVDCCCKFGFGN